MEQQIWELLFLASNQYGTNSATTNYTQDQTPLYEDLPPDQRRQFDERLNALWAPFTSSAPLQEDYSPAASNPSSTSAPDFPVHAVPSISPPLEWSPAPPVATPAGHPKTVCAWCGVSVVTEKLRRHQEYTCSLNPNRTGVMFRCDVSGCPKEYGRKDYLRRHQRERHGL